MTSPVANERIPALAPLHTDIQWLGMRPFQGNNGDCAFQVETKLSGSVLNFIYPNIPLLDAHVTRSVVRQLGRTVTPVGDLIRAANEVMAIAETYQSIPGLSQGTKDKLSDAKDAMDRVFRQLDLAGQVAFPELLLDRNKHNLKCAAIDNASDAISSAIISIIAAAPSLVTARAVSRSLEHQLRLDRMTMSRVAGIFDLYALFFNRQLLA